jgi:ribosomal protein L11 methyltransferase
MQSRFHFVAANILADVILELLDEVDGVLKPGGFFICSGIIEAYERKVILKMTAKGLDLLESRKEGDWVALVGQKQ